MLRRGSRFRSMAMALTRDWLYVDDHVEALLLAATRPDRRQLLHRRQRGTHNRQVVEAICSLMDRFRPQGKPHGRLITR